MRSTALLLVALVASAAALPCAAQDAKPEPVSFVKQVAPLLLKKCSACHGQTQPKGGFQMFSFEALMKPGDSTLASITPGTPDDSELLRLISETDPKEWMPKEGDRLADADIALVKRWIEEGAKFDGPDVKATLASIVPTTYDPAPEAYRLPVPVSAVAFNPKGDELFVGGYNEVTVWNPADGQLLRRIKNLPQRIHGLAFNPDGSVLAIAGGTPGALGEVKLVSPATGDTIRVLSTTGDEAFGVAFNHDGTRAASCAADRAIRVFDVASGKEELTIEDHADWVLAIAWNHDGTRLASASRDKTSKVFDAKTGESLTTYNGHGNTVFGVAFSADGTQVLSSGADRKIHVWSPTDAKKIAEIAGYGNEVYQLVRQGDVLFSCAADNTARKHTISNRAQVHSYGGHGDWVFAVSSHEGTKRLATGCFNGEVRLFNTEDGKEVSKFFAAPGYAQK
ncbi:MAG: hypothetical protein HYS13_18250 [Planctomycetia bacterium]|nr:hypothetical protein [Planctomycetia bacterium]